MPLRSTDMVQLATYWSPGVNDGFGKLNFAAVVPVPVYCRWQDAAVLFRDTLGREVTSEAVVYVASSVEVRGYLDLDPGAVTGTAGAVDPRELAGAREIRQISVSPSLTGDEELWKVYL